MYVIVRTCVKCKVGKGLAKQLQLPINVYYFILYIIFILNNIYNSLESFNVESLNAFLFFQKVIKVTWYSTSYLLIYLWSRISAAVKVKCTFFGFVSLHDLLFISLKPETVFAVHWFACKWKTNSLVNQSIISWSGALNDQMQELQKRK